MTIPPGQSTAVARERARERAAHEAEVARLNARVRELEQSNEALGKAIGLLHVMNEQEPAATPTTTDPSDSSTAETDLVGELTGDHRLAAQSVGPCWALTLELALPPQTAAAGALSRSRRSTGVSIADQRAGSRSGC